MLGHDPPDNQSLEPVSGRTRREEVESDEEGEKGRGREGGREGDRRSRVMKEGREREE